MKTRVRFSIYIFLLVLTACKSNDDPKPTVTNLTGNLSYQNKTFRIKGGLLDEDLYNSDKSRHSIHFKISDQPIESFEDTLTFYFASTESISLDFILTGTDGGPLTSGIYQFQDTSAKGVTLQSGLVLHNANASFGTGAGPTSGGSNYTVKSGTVNLQGTFPDYEVTVDFILDNGEITGKASGVFITRATWSNYFK